MNLRQYLLIRSSQPENLYGRFTAEIITAEGLNGFRCVDLDRKPLPDLGPGDLAILTRCYLRDAEIDALLTAIEQGARVVCLQPSPRLATRLGWTTLKRVIYPGWVQIRNGLPGSGMPIQTHVPVALYQPDKLGDTWTSVAQAVGADWADSGCPAVVQQSLGAGKIALFFYDLPLAVARIRFGNPELASHLTTGLWDFLHAADLFIGHVDERVKRLPQADFHGQLLVKVLTDVAVYPLARLWYYPEAGQRSVAVVQSDDDWSTPEQFRALSAALRKRGGSATFYLVKDTALTEGEVAQLRSEGHTFAPHVNPRLCRDEWRFTFPDAIREETLLFKQRFGACSPSIQCHCAPWQGYMDWVPEFMRNGYRLLFAPLSLPVPMLNAYMCGSGRALRFYDRDGTLFDCWHQPVVTYDDASVTERIRNNVADVIGDFERILRSALERTHTALPLLSHPVSYATYSSPFIEGCLDLLQVEGVPIFNGDQWCDFLDRRSAVRVRQSRLADGTLRTVVEHLRGRLALMLPVAAGGGATPPPVKINNAPASGVVHHRLDQDYLFVAVDAEGDEGRVTVDARLSGSEGP